MLYSLALQPLPAQLQQLPPVQSPQTLPQNNHCVILVKELLYSYYFSQPGGTNILVKKKQIIKYGQFSRTFRFDVLVIYWCRRIKLGILCYEIHLLVTKTKLDNIFCLYIYNTARKFASDTCEMSFERSVHFTSLNIWKSDTFILYNIKIWESRNLIKNYSRI